MSLPELWTPWAGLGWVLGLAVSAALYALWARWLARRFRLPEPVGERLTVELDRPGHHIGLTHLAPIRSRYREPVILCHGVAANRFNLDFHPPGSDRLSLARALVREGFDVWLLETRGHGHARVPAGATWTLEEERDQDVPTAIQTVLDLSGAERVLWVGHSWGGLLPLLHQAAGTGPVRDRVAGLVAVGSPGRFDVQGWQHPLLRPWLHALPRLPKVGWPLRWLAHLSLPVAPWAIRLVAHRVPQVSRLTPDQLRHLLASIPENIPACKIDSLLAWGRAKEPVGPDGSPLDWSRVQCPVYLVGGDRDWVAPPAAVMAWKERLTAEVEIFGTAEAPFGHAGLLLGEAAPDLVFPAILRWLQGTATPYVLQRLTGVAKRA
jgi:pimeloyl-ACP methyl ester carboxylesterase